MTAARAVPLDQLPMGAAILTDGVVTAANIAFGQVLRTPPDALVGRHIGELLGPEEAVAIGRRLDGRPDDGEPAAGAVVEKESVWSEVAGLAPDGAPWIGELAIGEQSSAAVRTVFLATTGPPVAIEGHPAEGGDRAHACAWEVLELDRILSHDVRGGLRGVNSFLTLLGRELSEPRTEQEAEFLETASAAGARTDAMVERLVNLLRITLRPVTLAPTPLRPLVESAAARSVDQLAGPAPTLEVPDLPAVWASRALLLDGLTELVTNARKFAERSVRIRFGATLTGPWLYLQIQDDGPGVEPNLADDAFLPFRLLQPKGRFPGVGMGLTTCRQIARAHGGRCWIEPDDPPGARVVLRLAVAP